MTVPFVEMKRAGEDVLQRLRSHNAALDYDADSITWIDGYIDRNRDVFSVEKKYGWAVAFGYILGEAILRANGGTWEYDDEMQQWVVNVGEPVGKANVIAKAHKNLSGLYESLASMYRVTQLVRAKGGWDKIGSPAESLRPKEEG